MEREQPPHTIIHPATTKDVRALSHQILHYATCDISHIDFLREITKLLLDFTDCETIELWMRKEEKCFHCKSANFPDPAFTIEIVRSNPDSQYAHPHAVQQKSEKDRSCVDIPIRFAEETIGLIQFKNAKKKEFCKNALNSYKKIAMTLGLAFINQLTHAALRERVKELTCLYSLAKLTERPNRTLEEILQGIVDLLPHAWQYPEITAGRILFDGNSFATANFIQEKKSQMAKIVVHGKLRGLIEVVYLEEKPEMDEGPFLKEERNLIDALAHQISLIVRRRQADEEKKYLQDQLRHADRLATIGQLAAGVAHELNEPLGNILGYAQLAEKQAGLPPQVNKDLSQIVKMSLHAREVVKKLMLFARQMPPRITKVNLNLVIEEALSLLESRCVQNDITLIRRLSPELPEMTIDPSQMHQVIVNLVVNAIQAMPDGGSITITTVASDDQIVLTIKDNGIGMSEEVRKQLFIPFFTTKDINEGTGLGLPVVHGIITSHGGAIDVESRPGQGSRFEIRLPLRFVQPDKEKIFDDDIV